MTWLTESKKARVQSRYFVRLRPKRRAQSFTVFSGNTWQADFDYGFVSRVDVDGVKYNLQTSLPLSSETFYYDRQLKRLYVHSTTDPSTAKFVVAHYELYLTELDEELTRDPMDATSEFALWNGYLLQAPQFSQDATNIIFGFLPDNATSIGINNADGWFFRHAYDSSFARARVDVYHCLGDIAPANFRRVFTGLTFNWQGNQQISLQVRNMFSVFDKQYVSAKEFEQSDFPNCFDVARPIPVIYGRIDNHTPTNIDSSRVLGVAASTTNNRDWVVAQGQSNLANVTRTIDTGASNTSTQTFLVGPDYADGLAIGDWIKIDNSGGSTKYARITAINYNTGEVVHTAVGIRSILAGDKVYRYHVGAVRIVTGEGSANRFELFPDRDYQVTTFANGTRGFTLTDNFEASVIAQDGSTVFPTPFNPDDHRIFCRAYGPTDLANLAVANVNLATAGQRNGGVVANPVALIYQFLLEITEIEPLDQIDEASFQAAASAVTDSAGFTIPLDPPQSEYLPGAGIAAFNSYKELILEMLRLGLLRMQVNDVSGKAGLGLSVVQPNPASSDEYTVQEASFGDFSVDYADIMTNGSVTYNEAVNALNLEIAEQRVLLEDLGLDTSTARYLHGAVASNDFTTKHYINEDAEIWLKRVFYFLSERRQTVTLETKHLAQEREIGDVVEVVREGLPGFEKTSGVERSRDMLVLQTQKTSGGVRLILDDQKGVEDNSGDW